MKRSSLESQSSVRVRCIGCGYRWWVPQVTGKGDPAVCPRCQGTRTLAQQLLTVDTTLPAREVWEFWTRYATVSGATALLRRRIDAAFFFVNLGQQARSVTRLARGGANYQQFVPINKNDIEEKSAIVALGVQQAAEYYRAAQAASELTRPALLYYGMVQLSAALFHATFKSRFRASHGMSWVDDGSPFGRVVALRRGLLSALVRCYADSLVPYERISRRIDGISLDVLMACQPNLDYYLDVVGLQPPMQNMPLPMHGHPTLAEQMMGLYLICHACRYRPLQWGTIMQGGESNLGYVLRPYVRFIETEFPIQVLSCLEDTKYWMFTAAKLAGPPYARGVYG